MTASIKAGLRTTRLSFARHNQEALFSNLELSLNPGQGLLVYGPNGSGKTSLLRVLAGLLGATEGNISWDGLTLEHSRCAYRQNLHFLGHAHGIKNGLSVKENLAYSHSLATLQPLDPQQLTETLQQVQLSAFSHWPAQQLSAGQKRRLALARLLIAPKPLWILDEPFTNLDQHCQHWFGEQLENHLQQQGIAIIAAHHALPLQKKELFQTLYLEGAVDV
jgi:heme exporter protein A